MKLLPICSLLAAYSAIGASFNCKLAKTPVERAVCADSSLSALDERLAQSYKQALAKAGEGDLTLRIEERQWLDDTSARCDGGDLVPCIREAYAARIGELDSRAPFDPASIKEDRYTDKSRFFDFIVRMQPRDPGGNEGPGRVLVFKKGAAAPFQTITIDNICDYDVIEVGDFNFDGHEDLAIQNGNGGGYGSPSYDVYLFSPTQASFKFSKPFSELAGRSLDFFHLDVARKRLSTSMKSGCCYHETDEFEVTNNRPVPVSRVVEDATKEEGYVYVSHQQMVNGKWQGTSKRIPIKVYYKDSD